MRWHVDARKTWSVPVFVLRIKKGRLSGPFFYVQSYFVSWIRLMSEAYFEPYLSRTGCVAS